jgi:hypothetical protein
MSLNDQKNSLDSHNYNTIQKIKNEFEFSNDKEDELNKIVINFYKTFSENFSIFNKNNHNSKMKFEPKLYEAKSENIAKIYEKEGKLFLRSLNNEIEFDKFFTQVNKFKEQKKKIIQNIKKESLFETPLYKRINLNKLNNKIYEETMINTKIKYDVLNSIFFPQNDRCLNKDDNLVFNLNMKPNYNNHGVLLFDDNIFVMSKNKDGGKINNIKKYDSIFLNPEIMIEISKYNDFIQENISLFLLNLSNEQNRIENLINYDTLNKHYNTDQNDIILSSPTEIIKTTENIHVLDLINHFNNIFTPKIYNKYSLYKNIKINNPCQVLDNINSILNLENNIENDTENNEEELFYDIKQYFENELIKEINKDEIIYQNFTHFYIEGNNFSKDNLKKIVAFLSKENYKMFAWNYNKEETKKFGLIKNIIKVANLSNKIWFYINNNNENYN